MKKEGRISTVDMANYIVRYTNINNCYITNSQMQKILYFLELKHLKETGEKLFDEDFVAYKYGPRALDAYSKYSFFGYDTMLIFNDLHLEAITDLYSKEELNDLNNIIKALSIVPNEVLEDIIRQKYSAWFKTFIVDERCFDNIKTEYIMNDTDVFKGINELIADSRGA